MKGNNVKEISVRDFINDNYKNIVLGIFILFVIYGKQIYSTNVRIDTETVLNNPKHLNFITLGRQGALFIRLLFEQLNFNPYFAVLMAVIILSCNMILLGYVFNYIGKIKFKYSMIMYFIYCSSNMGGTILF